MTKVSITLQGVTNKSLIIVRVQLHSESAEHETIKTDDLSTMKKRSLSQQRRATSKEQKSKQVIVVKEGTPRTSSRLLPSDRLVFNFLYARVPSGSDTTPAVRLQELMDECSISRRQVGICLRRLAEKGLVKRLNEEAGSGNPQGYRYRVFMTHG